jgi:protein involved in sex pheromone biosynthesis
MKRGQFLKRLGFGTVAAVVAPIVLIEALKKEEVVKVADNLIPTRKGHFVGNGFISEIDEVGQWDRRITQKNYLAPFDYTSQYSPDMEALHRKFNDKIERALSLITQVS